VANAALGLFLNQLFAAQVQLIHKVEILRVSLQQVFTFRNRIVDLEFQFWLQSKSLNRLGLLEAQPCIRAIDRRTATRDNRSFLHVVRYPLLFAFNHGWKEERHTERKDSVVHDVIERRAFFHSEVTEIHADCSPVVDEDFCTDTYVEAEVVVTFSHVVSSTRCCEKVEVQNLFGEDAELTVNRRPHKVTAENMFVWIWTWVQGNTASRRLDCRRYRRWSEDCRTGCLQGLLAKLCFGGRHKHSSLQTLAFRGNGRCSGLLPTDSEGKGYRRSNPCRV
jgi:hypothetical protein